MAISLIDDHWDRLHIIWVYHENDCTGKTKKITATRISDKVIKCYNARPKSHERIVHSTQNGKDTHIHRPKEIEKPDCSRYETAKTFCRLDIGVIIPVCSCTLEKNSYALFITR